MIQKHEMTYDQLIVGTFPVVMDSVTLKSGAQYKRGSVLGVITTEGKAVLVDKAKSDGSENAYAVLAEDVDASEADKVGSVYLSGEFNQDALIFAEGNTAADHKAALRNLSIYLKTVGK